MAQGRGSRPSSSSPLGEQPGNDAAAVYVDVTVADENGFPAIPEMPDEPAANSTAGGPASKAEVNSATRSPLLSRLSNLSLAGERRRGSQASMNTMHDMGRPVPEPVLRLRSSNAYGGSTGSLNKAIRKISGLIRRENTVVESDEPKEEERYITDELPMPPANSDPFEADIHFEEIERQRRQEQKRTCTSILLILLLSAVLMIPGVVSAASFPNATLLGVPLLMWSVFLCFITWEVLVVKLIVKTVQICLNIFFGTHMWVHYYFASMTWCIKLTIWSIGAVITYQCVFAAEAFDPSDGPVDGDANKEAIWWVQSILLSLLVTGVAFGLKVILVKRLALNFHQAAFFDRIDKSLYAEYALKKLMKPRAFVFFGHKARASIIPGLSNLNFFHRSQDDHDEKKVMGTVENLNDLSEFESKLCGASVDITKPVPMHPEANRTGSKVKESQTTRSEESYARGDWFTKTGRILKSNIPGSTFLMRSKELDQGIVGTGDKPYATVAEKVFENIKGDADRDVLLPEDFEAFFPDEDKAHRAFALFDSNGDGSVSIRECKDTIRSIYKERKSLRRSLHDSKTTVSKLNQLLSVVLLFFMLFVYLAIFRVQLEKFLVLYSGIVVASAFIFGDSLKTIFNCALFVFVTHPYDVGDRVIIGTTIPDTLFVHKINFYTTVFRKWNGEIIYYPNSQLLLTPISNLRRTGDMVDQLNIECSRLTTEAQISELRDRVKKFVAANSVDYHPECDIRFTTMDDDHRLRMALFVRHRGNWQDMEEKFDKRHKLITGVKRILDDLHIYYYRPAQPMVESGDPIQVTLSGKWYKEKSGYVPVHEITPPTKEMLAADEEDKSKKDECKCCMCRKKREEEEVKECKLGQKENEDGDDDGDAD